MSQPSPALLPGPFQNLREQIVQCFAVTAAKCVQRPVIRRRSSRQKTKPQILARALLQTPTRSYAQTVGVQPEFQQQPRIIARLTFFAIAVFDGFQIQPLDDLMHEKTE